jgi:hypothetical protein
MVTPRGGQHGTAVDTPAGTGVDQELAATHRSVALSAAARSVISARLRATLAARAAALATSFRSVSSRLVVPQQPGSTSEIQRLIIGRAVTGLDVR